MAVPDPTLELIRAMLERRSRTPAPTWIVDRAMRAVATMPRQGRGAARRLPPRMSASAALLAGLAVAILALLVVLVVLVGSPGPWAPGGAGASAGVAAATARATAERPSGATSGSPEGTSGPAEPSLGPDALAIVTDDGDGLRVRSAPTTDNARSRKLEPLLPKGARMYVVDGPVNADAMDWYEVQVLDEATPLFGWVSSGKDGEAWIAPYAPWCPGALAAQEFAAIPPLAFLACYGSARVPIAATLVGIRDASEAPCPIGKPNRACDAQPGWLFDDRILRYRAGNGTEQEITIAVPPALASTIADVPVGAKLSMTVAMDHPDAASCRVTNPANGRDRVPPDQAITACRVRFVVEDVAWAP